MTAGLDPYAVLDVSRDAAGEQIAQARHQLVRRYHPDLNPAPDAAAARRSPRRLPTPPVTRFTEALRYP